MTWGRKWSSLSIQGQRMPSPTFKTSKPKCTRRVTDVVKVWESQQFDGKMSLRRRKKLSIGRNYITGFLQEFLHFALHSGTYDNQAKNTLGPTTTVIILVVLTLCWLSNLFSFDYIWAFKKDNQFFTFNLAFQWTDCYAKRFFAEKLAFTVGPPRLNATSLHWGNLYFHS